LERLATHNSWGEGYAMPHAYRALNGDVIRGARKPEVPSVSKVTPLQLVIRCLLEQLAEDQWQAFTLEFGLAVQGESADEVKHKLDAMVDSYVRDALTGEDREHAYALLMRKATLSVYLKYYFAALRSHLSGFVGGTTSMIYREPVPLEPRACT
jgi:hypothetical protein